VPGARPEITVPAPARVRRPGVRVHETDRLDAVDVTSVDGIPTTRPARTLLDLGAVAPVGVVELAAHDAVIRNAVTTVDLLCVLERLGGPGRRGTAALRAAARAGLPPDELESTLELALYRLVRACPVPAPVLQHPVVLPGGRRVRFDFAWPARRVAVEADGRRWHATRADFERDLDRANAIAATDWRHFRYGWAPVHERPAAVRAEITAAVAVGT
jgi:hypothetical protein